MAGGDRSGCAASHCKFTCHDHFPRFQYGDQIVKYGIHHRFVKNTLIAEGEEVEFEAFHFDAAAIGDVGDGDDGKIGLAGDGAEAGEFGEDEADFVISLGARIVEGVEDVAVVLRGNGLGACGNGAIFPQEL